MTGSGFAIPEPVRRKVAVRGAHRWLRDLPDLVDGLAADWRLTIEEPLTGGTEAVVLAAHTDAGEATVLKLMIPGPDGFGDGPAADELTALRIADGDGCVRVLRSDPDRGAVLLERLGPTLAQAGLPTPERQAILCGLAARVWRPAADSGLPTGARKALRLVDYVRQDWLALDRPCSERAVEHAVACAHRRAAAHDDDRARLVHGDVHQWNALATPDGGWALIDPDGLLAEPAYDIGVILREDPLDMLAEGHDVTAARLAGYVGLDPVPVAEWAAIERVATGLVLVRIGMHDVARDMLHAADVVAGGRTER